MLTTMISSSHVWEELGLPQINLVGPIQRHYDGLGQSQSAEQRKLARDPKIKR